MENRRRESLTVLRKLAVEPSTRRNRLQTAGRGNTLFSTKKTAKPGLPVRSTNRNVRQASCLPPSGPKPLVSLALKRSLGRQDACPTFPARFRSSRPEFLRASLFWMNGCPLPSTPRPTSGAMANAAGRTWRCPERRPSGHSGRYPPARWRPHPPSWPDSACRWPGA